MTTLTQQLLHPAPFPADIIPPQSLDDAFCGVIVDLASLPLRTATQKGPGVLRQDGLGTVTLRMLALHWCMWMRDFGMFDPEELRALAQAISDFSDDELTAFVRGATVAYNR